jgi:hypothetical protein
VDVCAPFVADEQALELVQPGEGALVSDAFEKLTGAKLASEASLSSSLSRV